MDQKKTPAPPSHKSVIRQEIINLYDDYTHRPLPRRTLLKRMTLITGSLAITESLLSYLESGQAHATISDPADPALVSTPISYVSEGRPVSAYLTHPQKAGKFPAVMVIHENRGLNDHMRDVARRLALEGFLVLAPDALSLSDKKAHDPDEARTLMRDLNREKTYKLYLDGIEYLKSHALSTGKIASMGFCWGGSMSGQMAVRAKGLSGSVVYYGRPPSPDQVALIKIPLLLHYAGLDKRLNGFLPAYESALKAAGTDYDLTVWPGVNHAFNNDTSVARYDQKVAAAAWVKTLAFLRKSLID